MDRKWILRHSSGPSELNNKCLLIKFLQVCMHTNELSHPGTHLASIEKLKSFGIIIKEIKTKLSLWNASHILAHNL
jgi:hypothetical protein